MTKISEAHWKSDQAPSMHRPLKYKVILYFKKKKDEPIKGFELVFASYYSTKF